MMGPKTMMAPMTTTTTEPPDKASDTSWHYFSRLPVELRLKIWDMTLPNPDGDPEPEVYFFCDFHYPPREDDEAPTRLVVCGRDYGDTLPHMVPTGFPVAMHVCSESRSVAKKHAAAQSPPPPTVPYTRLSTRQAIPPSHERYCYLLSPMETDDDEPLRRRRRGPVNLQQPAEMQVPARRYRPELDVLFCGTADLSSANALGALQRSLRVTPSKFADCARIALPYALFDSSMYLILYVIKDMPGLERIDVLFGRIPDDGLAAFSFQESLCRRAYGRYVVRDWPDPQGQLVHGVAESTFDVEPAMKDVVRDLNDADPQGVKKWVLGRNIHASWMVRRKIVG